MNPVMGQSAHAVIIHGVTDASRPDEQDTLDQVREIAAALSRLDWTVETLALTLDLSPLAMLETETPTVVFNIVEALAGDGRLIHLAPAVMEHLGLVFTGSGARAVSLTTDKVLTKRLLDQAGVPVPEGLEETQGLAEDTVFIVKPLFEDASFGIDAGSVVPLSSVAKEMTQRADRFGGAWFAERFIAGREFNVSVIETADGTAEVLPLAEIVFEDFPDNRPRIVDYEAKWEPESLASIGTPRRFLDEAAESKLARDLRTMAVAAWRALGLSGYARIDFRVDAAGRCYVLEANANPCLSPDAGFAAAAHQAGMSYDQMISRIALVARRHGRAAAGARSY